jgi:hypothetical protein
MPLNTAVVYGSARRARQGIKAARFIVRQLRASLSGNSKREVMPSPLSTQKNSSCRRWT